MIHFSFTVQVRLCNDKLVHALTICEAGKDRTGVMAAILLKVYLTLSVLHCNHFLSMQLSGVDDHYICHDYSLTRIGREPEREKVLRRLSKEPMFAANTNAALRMLSSQYECFGGFLSLH